MFTRGKGSLSQTVIALMARSDQINTGRLRAVFVFGEVIKSALLRTGVVLVTTCVLALSSVLLFTSPKAHAATSSTLAFQGRLLSNTGSVVADGAYNIRFKIYDGGTSGGGAGAGEANAGTLLWTDARYDQNGGTAGLDFRVTVKYGYFSVNLGDTNAGGTAFPSTINWDQELWLTMDVGGTTQTATPTYDGEMLTTGNKRFKLTAVPYAFQAGNALGVSSNPTSTASTNSNGVTITSGNATGATSNSGNVSIQVGTATQTRGTITIGTTNAPSSLTIGNTATGFTLQGLSSSTITGSNGGFTTTLGFTTPTANQTYNLPNSTAGTYSICTSANNCSSLTGYIQNNTALQTTANFNIQSGAIGNITANFQAFTGQTAEVLRVRDSTNTTTVFSVLPSGNTLVGGTLNVTGNVVVGASSSLTVTGGNTASRPGSPTEGMVYFDTTTKQLLTYSNGKWQSDRNSSTKIVAASNASQAAQDGADYVSNGENSAGAGTGTIDGDQIEINNALTAVSGLGGGTVYLTEGTFTIDASISIPNNVTLAGSGNGTLVQMGNFGATSTSFDMFVNTSNGAGAGTNIGIRDLRIDGRKSINTAGTQNGIVLTNMGSGTGSTAKPGMRMQDVQVANLLLVGVKYVTSDNNIITSSVVTNSGSDNVQMTGGDDYNTFSNSVFSAGGAGSGSGINMFVGTANTNNLITGNIIQSNGSSGVNINGSNSNTISNNSIVGNSVGINLVNFGTANTISNNTITGNTNQGIIATNTSYTNITGNYIASNTDGVSLITSSSNNQINGNTLNGNTNRSIYINTSSANNTVTDNRISDSGGATANSAIVIDASGSNTITGNTITDSSCTTSCIAITTQTSGATNNYFSNNVLSGGSATTPATISDGIAGNIFANQTSAVAGNLQSTSTVIKARSSGSLTGTVATNNTTTLTGTGSVFVQEIQIGDRITANAETRTVTAIATNTSLTVDVAFTTTASGLTATRLPSALLVRNASAVNVLNVNDIGAAVFQNSTNSTSALMVQNAAGTSVLKIDTTNQITTLRGTATDAVISGTNLAAATSCSGTNWAGTGPWTHTTGSIAALTCTVPASVTSGATYQVTYTVASNTNTTDTVTATLGGVATPAQSANTVHTVMVTTTATTGITFTPTTNFNGSVNTIVINLVTPANSVLSLQNNAGTDSLQARASGVVTNAFVGLNSGLTNTTGASNAGFGSSALMFNTTGSFNTALGASALQNNTTGSQNTAFGYNTLAKNTTGSTNIAIGYTTLQANTTGSGNIAIGSTALASNTTANDSIAIGNQALNLSVSGAGNVAIGVAALQSSVVAADNTAVGYNTLSGSTGGRNTAYGSSAGGYNTSGINNTFLGANAGYGDGSFFTQQGISNSGAIGWQSVVQASNSLILGGQGTNAVNVGIGTTMPTNTFSVSPIQYSTGSASITTGTTTVNGTGTTFTAQMVGSEIIIDGGSQSIAPYKGTVTAFTNSTTITVSPAAGSTYTTKPYRIHYKGLQVSSAGLVGVGGLPDGTRALTITAAGAGRDYLAFAENGVTKWHVVATVSGDLDFTESGVANNRLYLKAGGNVGIGDGSPASLLSVGAGDLFQVTSAGVVTMNGSATSTGQLEVRDGSSTTQTLIVVDSTNDNVYIGDTTADATGVQLVVDTKNTAGDPTGVNGGIYYNSSTNRFRCFQNSGWTDCIGGIGSLTDNIADAFDLQEGTNNYININTTNGSENISLGNATTNPSFSLLGSGNLTVGGNILSANSATGTTRTTEATARTNVTTVTITVAGFANNDIILITNAGQSYYTRITAGGGTTSLTVSPAVSYDASATVTLYQNMRNIGATNTDYTTQTNRFFQGYFLGGVVAGAGSTILSDGSLTTTLGNAFTLQSYSNIIKGTNNVITGSIDPTASTSVTGVGTRFLTELQVGDMITVNAEIRKVVSIASNTVLTVETAFTDTANDTVIDRTPAALIVRNNANVSIMTNYANGDVKFGGGSPGTAGALEVTVGGSSPIANRLQYGTDGTGWKFAISKNQGGTVTDQLVLQDNGNFGIGTSSPDGLQVNVAVSETARGVDNARLGVVSGTPRLILEDNGFTQFEIDNSGGTLRIFQPGAVKLSVDSSGNTSQTGVINVNGTGVSAIAGTLNVDGGSSSNWAALNVGNVVGGAGIQTSGTIYSYNLICVQTISGTCTNSGNSGTVMTSNQFYCPGTGACHMNYSGTGVTNIGNTTSGNVLYGPVTAGGNQFSNGVDSWLRTTGSTGWYSQTYGGGWYMEDTTWIRSYNSKPVFMSNGLDTGSPSGIGCGGGLGGGYMMQVCGTFNSTGTLRTDASLSQAVFPVGGSTTLCQGGFGTISICTSSARYKTNIQDASWNLDTIRAMRPVTYTRTENSQNEFGFIAEEITQIDSRFGVYVNGRLEGVQYMYLTSVLASGLKQLDVQVQTNDTRLDVIEAGQFSGNLSVAGDTSLNGNLTVQGITTVADLIVTGDTEVQKITVVAGIKLGGRVNQDTNVVTKVFKATENLLAGQVVVLDGANAGQVKLTTAALDRKVVGVTTVDALAGSDVEIAIYGNIQTEVDPSTTVGIGDLMVTDATAGMAKPDVNPTVGSVVGKATSVKDANNLVWVMIALN